MAHDQWCEAHLVPTAWNAAGFCNCRRRELSAEVAALRQERDAARALLRGVTEVHCSFYYEAEIGKHTPYVELRFSAADWDSRDACARAIDAALAALKGDAK